MIYKKRILVRGSDVVKYVQVRGDILEHERSGKQSRSADFCVIMDWHGRAAAYIVCCVLVAMISSGWLVAEGWQGKEEMNTLQTLSYLDGTRFCLIYMDVLDEVLEKVKLTPVHGVARVMSDRLIVEESSGNQLVVPDSALPSITPSDGTVLLKDAEHYVIIKIGVRS